MLRRLKSLKILAFALVAAGVFFGAELSQAVAESFLVEDENQMTALVNQHRSQIGLGQLSSNDALRTVARRQAQRMVVAGYIYHNPDLGKEANDAVPGWLLLGENVGVGPTAPAVEEAFLNSPKHRENIETGRFNIMGLGAMAAEDGAKYFTQNFAQWSPKAPAPQPQAPARPARTPLPVVRVPTQQAQRPAATPARQPAAATPVPTVAPPPTPAPTVAPVATAGVLGEQQTSKVGLGTGLVAMLARFFSKLAFWS